MAFNVTFNNISVISWRSVLLVEETGVPSENHWPVVSHWQTLSHNELHFEVIYAQMISHEMQFDTIKTFEKQNLHALSYLNIFVKSHYLQIFQHLKKKLLFRSILNWFTPVNVSDFSEIKITRIIWIYNREKLTNFFFLFAYK
jgi:hypothetical protein